MVATTQTVLAYPPEGEVAAIADVEPSRPVPVEAAQPVIEAEPDLTPAIDRPDYPPLLNVGMPVLMLVVSGAYAWSLRDMVNPGMNLLLLKPLFVVIWKATAG